MIQQYAAPAHQNPWRNDLARGCAVTVYFKNEAARVSSHISNKSFAIRSGVGWIGGPFSKLMGGGEAAVNSKN